MAKPFDEHGENAFDFLSKIDGISFCDAIIIHYTHSSATEWDKYNEERVVLEQRRDTGGFRGVPVSIVFRPSACSAYLIHKSIYWVESTCCRCTNRPDADQINLSVLTYHCRLPARPQQNRLSSFNLINIAPGHSHTSTCQASISRWDLYFILLFPVWIKLCGRPLNGRVK